MAIYFAEKHRYMSCLEYLVANGCPYEKIVQKLRYVSMRKFNSCQMTTVEPDSDVSSCVRAGLETIVIATADVGTIYEEWKEHKQSTPTNFVMCLSSPPALSPALSPAPPPAEVEGYQCDLTDVCANVDWSADALCNILNESDDIDDYYYDKLKCIEMVVRGRLRMMYSMNKGMRFDVNEQYVVDTFFACIQQAQADILSPVQRRHEL